MNKRLKELRQQPGYSQKNLASILEVAPLLLGHGNRDGKKSRLQDFSKSVLRFK